MKFSTENENRVFGNNPRESFWKRNPFWFPNQKTPFPNEFPKMVFWFPISTAYKMTANPLLEPFRGQLRSWLVSETVSGKRLTVFPTDLTFPEHGYYRGQREPKLAVFGP
jgi:hypothetical protein